MDDIKEQILFKAYCGSKLYGTDSENSDTDIKGVFLPFSKDLLLNKAPKHYVLNSGKQGVKNTKEDVDITYYSLHYFLELLSKGETNAMDLFFAYTNYEKVIVDSKIWSILIDNKNKIITKNIKSYLGYCKSQCIKFSIKGEKLKNYSTFEKFCEKCLDKKNENGDTETLFNCLNIQYNNDEASTLMSKPIIPNPGERFKIIFSKETEFNFGDHCYFETAQNKESYLTISDVKFQLNDSIKSAYHKIQKVIASYGKRAEKAVDNNGVDWKAISHCVRVILQVEELLTTNKITFPLINANFVKAIKYNTSSMTYEEIMSWIENHIMHIEEVLLPKSTLREKADFQWIEEFILNCYNKY